MAAVLGRLPKRRDFLRVAAAGRKAATPGLVLQACRRDPLDTAACSGGEPAGPRLGITASRKVGKAVTRNRARRRLRAAAEQVIGSGGARDHDYVVIARASTATRPFPELLADLQTALARVSTRRRERRGRREEIS